MSCIIRCSGKDVSKSISVLLGNDITIPCQILPVEESPLVLWEKIWPLPEFQLLTYNDRTTNNSKYVTIRNNSLIIRRVTLKDEGVYQCEIGDVKYKVSLNVSVSMTLLELTYDGSLPFTAGTAVALICRSTHSRPPADLRWFHGIADVTIKASKTLKKLTDENGFGNSEGILSVLIKDEQSDIPYRCIADLPGHHTVKTVFLFPLTTCFGNSEGILSVLIKDEQSDIPYRCIADLPGHHTVKTVFLLSLTTSSSSGITSWYTWLIIFFLSLFY
ncbi:hypothetical protein LOTGIDRAFT_166399 [Lottia gigantea]|uniref:Ig-like domain-containing protein n=1 Tax=Lottia gigantea TaxID=225164 RepID=V3Z9D4_LOTGI|nr:hypothetical protein LOTGIDRAFT_166399 [Lottia gigantea]ESO87518.1 hypothetical protein LOTGIDRAFT_166399 [Lottia gigantea]